MKNKKSLEEARKLLLEATQIISNVVEGQDEDKDLDAWMEDRVELWCRIYKEGGIVTQARLHEIWRDIMGKNTKGLGGFFAGKNASLIKTPDEKIVLTKPASDAIKAWTGKTIAEYAKKFK